MTQVINPSNQAMSYRYDLALQTAELTDRNENHTRYSYDNRGLLVKKAVAETEDRIQYTYDEVGNRASMNDGSGQSRYAYDGNNRLLEVAKDGKTQLTYTYDAVGNVKSLKDKTGFTTSYTYDKSSRMSTVTAQGKTTSYSYDENGNRTSIAYAGGVKENYTFDRNSQLLKLVNTKADGAVLSEYSYTYDLSGNQLTKTDSYGATNYGYDEVGRIVKAEAPGKTTVFTYDRSGNRQSMLETYTSEQPTGYTDPISKAELTYIVKRSEYLYSNANELLQLTEQMKDAAGEEVLEKKVISLFDSNGNEVRQQTSYLRPHSRGMNQVTGANPYGDEQTEEISSLLEKVNNTFDGFNRLTQAINVQGGERSTVEYTYDGDDLRTQKTVRNSADGYAEQVTNYLYDRQYVILETDKANAVSVRYVKGINYIARIDQADKLSYFLFNGHGDVVQTVDEQGTIENQYDYDVFGSPTLTIELYESTIRYSGEFYDAEVGLYYLRARYYDPYVGRFISEDTYKGRANEPLSLNRYTYVLNNPLIYLDPTGMVEVALRDLVKATDAQLSCDSKTGITTIRLATGVSMQLNTKKIDEPIEKAKGYSIVNGRIIVDNETYDKWMTQSNSKSVSSITGGKVVINSKVEMFVGEGIIGSYVYIERLDYLPDSKNQSPKFSMVRDKVSILDLSTDKKDSINFLNNNGMNAEEQKIIKNLLGVMQTGNSPVKEISKHEDREIAAMIVLMNRRENSQFGDYLTYKYSNIGYSGNISKDIPERLYREGYVSAHLATQKLMKKGVSSLSSDDKKILRALYDGIYPDGTDAGFQEYLTQTANTKNGDMLSAIEGFFSGEMVLYAEYAYQGRASVANMRFEAEMQEISAGAGMYFAGGKASIKPGRYKTYAGCNCFTAGTKVLTDQGEKNIEDIEVGDRVLSKKTTQV
ncbi:RHS repeat-associated core domain-containing protein [Paenibacillus sp. Leaf72]|uniref:RHS repeat-associated core domain-containing protein n=1 Tax=Paenibacillus sp. Leaf72 TaxID=1736234 RepID=UPI0006F836C7|nr:RHS repeat-associated core domain-containing protein [Paenibacillus sp. Leaf72]KQN96006.1 hypothetical protein ASF12_24535 [Paenibacillus sp. Leaf72]